MFIIKIKIKMKLKLKWKTIIKEKLMMISKIMISKIKVKKVFKDNDMVIRDVGRSLVG